jgi:hypothetical protein
MDMAFVTFYNILSLVSGFIAIAVSIVILQKNIKQLINLLMGGAILFWGLSLLFQALCFAFPTPDFGAQLFRTISTSTAILGVSFLLASGISLLKGEYFLKKWFIIIPLLTITLTSIILVAIFDYVAYIDPDNPTDWDLKTTTQGNDWILIFLYGVPGIMILLAIILLFRTRSQIQQPLIRERILFFTLGNLAILLGLAIYGLGGVLEKPLNLDGKAGEKLFWFFAQTLLDCWTDSNVIWFLY